MLGDVTTVFTTPSAAKGIISANRDTEYIQSFTRVDTGDDSDDEKFEEGKPLKKKDGKSRKRDRKRDKKQENDEEGGKEDKDGRSSPRIPSKSTFAQISKELKARRLAQMAAAAKAKKSRKSKTRRQEEIYTDKDRAAAVNLGTRDIKQSLKLKKKQDRNHFQIPEEAEPGTLLALGNNELRSGDVKIALKFLNKALELNPGDKNSLVARSKCYLLLGEPSLALQDAETALQSDKTFIRAIHQKAEALYHLGDFEHSLMYYHRGHRLRPELEIFRLGVQKAQEAIENTIGCVPGLGGPPKTSSVPKIKGYESNRSEKSSVVGKAEATKSSGSTRSGKSESSSKRRSKSAISAVRRESKNLLGELGTDRIYLENLLKNPDIVCSNQEAANIIVAQAEEGIAFLKSRQEFWRQQRPKTSHGPPKNDEQVRRRENQGDGHSEFVSPPVTFFMGVDKYENEELIKWGWPEDVWFHADKVSSAHVYLRLNPGQTLDDIPTAVLEDAAQLVKANSIRGNKMNDVDILYTMWSNLKKTDYMEVGHIGLHKESEVRRIRVAKRINDIVTRLSKTKTEGHPDLRADREERDRNEKEAKKRLMRAQKEKEKEEEARKRKEAELRSYSTLFKPENMTSNQSDGNDSDEFM